MNLLHKKCKNWEIKNFNNSNVGSQTISQNSFFMTTMELYP